MNVFQKPLNFPSQQEANQAARVLSGTPKKYTITVHLPNGSRVEFQSDQKPDLKFFVEARALWIFAGEYKSEPIMQFEPGMIILTEENPKPA